MCSLIRMYHASALVGRKIVVHGGFDGQESFGDFWIFNTDSFSWMQPRTAGFAPTPRFGHTLTLIPDGRILVFGGSSLTKDGVIPKYHDDVRQLDTDTMIWTRPRTNEGTPTGRYGHTALLAGADKLIVFGGWGKGGCQSNEMINDPKAFTLHVMDTTSMTWFAPRRIGKRAARHLYNHGACLTEEGKLIIFGGYDGQQAVNDLYMIDIEATV